MAKAISEGNRIPYVPSAAVSSGDVVVLGDKPLIATHDIAANEPGSLMVEGLAAVEKEATTVVFAVGAPVYWDAADGEANADAANPIMGWAYEAAADTDTTVNIKLAQATA